MSIWGLHWNCIAWVESAGNDLVSGCATPKVAVFPVTLGRSQSRKRQHQRQTLVTAAIVLMWELFQSTRSGCSSRCECISRWNVTTIRIRPDRKYPAEYRIVIRSTFRTRSEYEANIRYSPRDKLHSFIHISVELLLSHISVEHYSTKVLNYSATLMWMKPPHFLDLPLTK